MAEKVNTVTVSDINHVIDGIPIVPPGASQRGIEAHKKIIGEVMNGLAPVGLIRAGLRSPVQREVTYRRIIAQDSELKLSARADLASNRVVVDLKPGSEPRDSHLLQAALTQYARGEGGNAVVFMYHNGDPYVIEGGGDVVGAEMEIIARNARRILDNEEELRHRSSLRGAARDSIGRQSWELRKELDKNLMVVMDCLKSNCVKV